MKQLLFCSITIVVFSSCNQSSITDRTLQQRVDSLEAKIADSYKPGFGEFMSSIQVHHAKLWFAGKNKNWELADFEIHEIGETLDAIKEYQNEREESKKIDMLKPALDAVNDAIL